MSTKNEYGQSNFLELYRHYRIQAIKRELEFSLSKEEFKKLTKGNCFYCGDTPKQIFSKKNKGYYGEYIYNGVDRLDNSIGYVLNNVVSCCGFCNVKKHSTNHKEFIEWISKVDCNMNQ